MYRIVASASSGVPISSVAFTGPGELVTGTVTGALVTWGLDQSELVPKAEITGRADHLTDGVVALTAASDRKTLAVSTFHNRISVYRVAGDAGASTGAEGDEDTQVSTSSEPTGANGAGAKTSEFELTDVLSVPNTRPWKLKFDPSNCNTLFASTSHGGVVRWDLQDADAEEPEYAYGTAPPAADKAPGGEAPAESSDGPAFASALDVSVDGTLLAVGHVDGAIAVSHATRGDAQEPKAVLQTKVTGSVRCVAFNTDGDLLLVASSLGVVYLFDVVGGELLRTFAGHEGAVQCVVPNPAGQYFSTGDVFGRVRVWDLKTAECVHQWEAGSAVLDMAYAPDGSLIAIADGSGTVQVCTVATPEVVHKLPAKKT